MRALIIDKDLKINVTETNKPKVMNGYALVKVAYSGVCGSDLSISQGGLKHRIDYPHIMGHEFSGIVEELNGETGFKKGDRVLVDPLFSCGICVPCENNQHQVCSQLKILGIEFKGSFTEYVSVPFQNMQRVPKELPDSLACLIEPLSVAYRAINRANLEKEENVLILGGGPIGLMLGIIAKDKGIENIFISEISPYRLKIAKKLGFKTIDSSKVKSLEEYFINNIGKKADAVFEAAGSLVTVKQMTTVVKEQGKIILVGLFKDPPLIDLSTMQYKEISLLTSRSYTRKEFKDAINIAIRQKSNLDKIISHVIDLKEACGVFDIIKTESNVLKILIRS